MAGNVWQWTDATIWSASGGGYASTTLSEMPDAGAAWTTSNWYQYTAITNYKSLGYARPDITTWSSTNGIGQIYLQADTTGQYRGFVRGGNWPTGAIAGVFTLGLFDAPDPHTNLGFRCSR
jgi:formylglycine-generating enzyme required for sulfatase activity